MAKNVLILLVLLCFSSFCIAQSRAISGKVTAQSDGSPLPGVNVAVKGSSTGTQTDAQGNFKLEVAPSAKVLVATYLGFKQKEAVISSGVISIVLEESQQSLSEVIITGYNQQNKREVTGSVATISGSKINDVPIGSFDQAMQGRAPGVLVQANSGQPGAAATITIRGRGSLQGSIVPLYVMDGIEITAGDFATINTQDIASLNILNDAVSTAQYGSRGASGVVVITTKQGKTGRPIVTYNGQFGRSKAPANKLVVMNTAQKLEYELANDNPNGWSDAEIAELRTIDTDWEKVFFKTGTTKSHNLTVSGGTDKTKYLVTGGIFDQTGIVPTTKLNRYNGRVNLSTGTNDFDFGVNTTFGYSKYTNTSEANTGIATPLNAIRWTNPYLAPYTATGAYSQNPTGQPNPLPELLENTNFRGQIKIVTNAYAMYRVPAVKGLFAKVNAGVDYTSNEVSNFVDPTTTTGASATGNRGSLTRGYGKLARYTITSSIGYNTTIEKDHHLGVTVFNEMVSARGNNFRFTGYGLGGPFDNEAGITPGTATNNFIPVVAGGGGSDPLNASSLAGKNGLLSYFTNIKYNYKEKYFIESFIRRDGSSRFGANKKYANFGSVGASWMLSSEDFFAPLKSTFSDLKLKASYGSAGNQSFSSSDFLSRELYTRSVYNGVSGLGQSQLASPDLGWERRTTFNAGIELTAWNGRIGGTFQYYNAITSDLFNNLQLSRTTGFTSYPANIGKLRNQGIEASLSVDVLKLKDFNWNINGNFTYNKGTVKELNGGLTENINGIINNRIGQRVNELYLVRYVGVNPANGNSIYLDANGNNTETFSAANRVLVGTIETPYFGGFGSTITYKGFTVSALFSYVAGNKIYNNDRTNVENPTYLADNLSVDLLREWRTPGQITDIPRASQAMQTSTRFVEDGKFLRLRNATVSYDFPKRWLSAIKVNGAQLFVQGQNLITWSKFKGFDPEYNTGNGGSLSGAQYPALRTVTAGVNISL